MITRVFSPTGVRSRGPSLDDADFAALVVERETLITPGSTEQLSEGDQMIERQTGATVDHEGEIQLGEVVAGALDDAEIINLDPGIATVTAEAGGAQVDRVSDGTARVLIRTRLLTRRLDVAVSRETPATVDTIIGAVAGSAREDATGAVDDALVGLSAATAKAIYTTQDHATPLYVRNPGCWAAAFDLTCISPWNSNLANRKAGTLLSPRHIIFSEHYQITAGATIRFVAADNTLVERTMTAKQNVGPSNGSDSYATDFTIGLLDSDVPASIGFAKVLPADWADRFPASSSGRRGEGIPVLALDQEEHALVDDVRTLLDNSDFYQSWAPTDPQRAAFHESKIVGDSGNPVFMILGGELVLLATWTLGLAGSGPAVHANRDAINAAMTTLGGGYQLTAADLSGFTDFGA